ncbi:MAG: hypothetical protein PHW87_07355 [Methanothrix sp.]|nr:hypothetical protein [Methanothrix sp.]
MALLSQKILDNRRRQHAVVTAHKRKIRDEIRPALMQTKRAWFESSRQSNRMIKDKWHTQKAKVSDMQRTQKLIHKAKILAHKRRIRSELASRR